MQALEIRSLEKRYGRQVVLRDLSLSVGRGQIYGLLGPNGAGKTTTLACALGLVRPTSGSARVLGVPAGRFHATRGKVGVVFDRAVLLGGLGVRQNLEYMRRLQGHRAGRGIDEVLELVGMRALARARAGRLSLGEAKRVAIAGALLGEPELLILDEPLSGLDAMGARAMLALCRRLAAEGLTLVLSSHRLIEMQSVVTHVGILVGGRIAKEGALGELLEEERRRYEIEAEPRALALRVAQGFAGARVELGAREGRLVVELDGPSPAALNAALVRAGCEVARLARVELSLATVFERLVDAGGATERGA